MKVRCSVCGAEPGQSTAHDCSKAPQEFIKNYKHKPGDFVTFTYPVSVNAIRVLREALVEIKAKAEAFHTAEQSQNWNKIIQLATKALEATKD